MQNTKRFDPYLICLDNFYSKYLQKIVFTRKNDIIHYTTNNLQFIWSVKPFNFFF